MSIAIVAMVLKRRLGSTARKAVAFKLADVADDEGANIWPSVKTVAAEAEVSERTVQYILAEFVKEGLLVVVEKRANGGSGTSKTTKYRFNINVLMSFPSTKTEPVINRGAKSAPHISTELPTGVQPEQVGGADSADSGCSPCTLSIPDPSDDPSDQREGAEVRSFERRTLEARRRPAQVHRFVSEEALNKVRSIAPNWDRQMLLAKFNAWPGSSNAQNMDAAFLGWVKKFTGGKKPG